MAPEKWDVHTRRFAFHAPQVHDESVKMSSTTLGRSSALPPALQAARPCAADDAKGIVILPALSVFCEGRPEPSLHAGPAAAGISPASLCTRCLQKHQFLFDTNEPLFRIPNFSTHTKQNTSFFLFGANECLSRTSNLAIHTKQTTSLQITAFFLFDTNEPSQITNHQSLITGTGSQDKPARTPS